MTNEMIPVKGRDDLVRDSNSKALLKTSLEELQEHRKKRMLFTQIHENNERLNKLESDMGNIQSTLSEILSFIKEKR